MQPKQTPTGETVVLLDCGHQVPATQVAQHVKTCNYYQPDRIGMADDPVDVPWGG